ncbi:hypothetical protein ABIF63_006055 [Bradyrhizobium japonicum]|uniref:Uncharacterized protein n=1 Tax=Bradyrhizobium japonicum TaxID=375 RepID=A0ABV2RYD2_BRAJP
MTINQPKQSLSLTASASSPPLTSRKSEGFQPQAVPCSRMVNAAAARIYAAWQPHVGHDDALREARAFAGRFHFLIDGPVAPLPSEDELDVTLAAVAAAMTILDAAAQ